MMKELYDGSEPEVYTNEWHLPLVNTGEKTREAAKISAARCARVSYLTHEGRCDPAADLDLYEKLASSGHMSPLEHPARPMTAHELKLFERPRYRWIRGEWHSARRSTYYCGNLNGWVSFRAMVPGEEDILGYRKANL